MREPLTTKVSEWFAARQAGRSAPEHVLRCALCHEPSETEVCEACIEAELSARTCEAVFEGVRA